MTTTIQHISSDPARRLADKILARTNNGQDLIVLLHDISRGGYDASKNDRITATNFLTDRGYGKCPKQSPASGDGGHTSNSVPAPVDDKPKTTKEPESPRLVTQVSDALHESLGPAPSAHTHTTKDVEPAPYSIPVAISRIARTRQSRHLSAFRPNFHPRLHNRNHQRRRNPCRYPHGDSRSRR